MMLALEGLHGRPVLGYLDCYFAQFQAMWTSKEHGPGWLRERLILWSRARHGVMEPPARTVTRGAERLYGQIWAR